MRRFVQYAKPSADPEWHLYDFEDVIYRDDPSTRESRDACRESRDARK